MKALAHLLFACVAGVLAGLSVCHAAQIGRLPQAARLIQADWQDPQALPPRLRNHCAYDQLRGRRYCSDHCGFDYQAYYCSPQSFGCCRVGFGYCDWNGLLRCHP